jgi:hypothetical protein
MVGSGVGAIVGRIVKVGAGVGGGRVAVGAGVAVGAVVGVSALKSIATGFISSGSETVPTALAGDNTIIKMVVIKMIAAIGPMIAGARILYHPGRVDLCFT